MKRNNYIKTFLVAAAALLASANGTEAQLGNALLRPPPCARHPRYGRLMTITLNFSVSPCTSASCRPTPSEASKRRLKPVIARSEATKQPEATKDCFVPRNDGERDNFAMMRSAKVSFYFEAPEQHGELSGGFVKTNYSEIQPVRIIS